MHYDGNSSVINQYNTEIEYLDNSNLSIRDKYIRLKQILEESCKEITLNESLQFSSLFSRLVFISQKYSLPKSLEWQLQNIRVKSAFLHRNSQHIVSEKQYKQAKDSVKAFHAFLNGETINNTPVTDVVENNISHDKIRVQILEIDLLNEFLLCRADHLSTDTIIVRYNDRSINEYFSDIVARLWIGAQLNLIDVKKNDDGSLAPKLIVVEPDYLIDASAIAECFQNYGHSYLNYFQRKLEPTVNSHHILLGNLANFFLDQLVYAKKPEELSFDNVFLESFRQMPFEYAACKEIKDSSNFKEFMEKARNHFENIRRVILCDMPTNGFDTKKCILEPSFFCEKYGFQGRLDLLELSDVKGGLDRIIELKSGKAPYPASDVGKIAQNHETQTAIYRLMIQSVFGKEPRQIYPTILYSAPNNSGENIRFAAYYAQLENEIIHIRNLIVSTEYLLYIGKIDLIERFFIELFNLDNYNNFPRFFIDKLDKLKKVLESISSLEKIYFYRYISFISRELYLQKTGDEGYNTSMSVSALWNTTFEERKDSLELIADLEIEQIDDSGKDMKIRLKKNDPTEYANFREGEICILYPRESEDDSVLTNQMLKGTIIELANEYIILRFRYKQRNRNFFERYKLWVVEHDKLDHTYNTMYKSLFSFLNAPKEKRNLLLGLSQPYSQYKNNGNIYTSKEEKQDIIINKALSAKDYFLIVGPPGTGKTSIFARRLIEELQKEKNILVIAYTNRAVDELCEAITNALDNIERDKGSYIRIGTNFSCGENYRHHLLQNIADKTNNRKELLDIISSTQIFVGTLASVVGKPELFDLKKFDIAIIDEASQILEPQIIGILPLFDKFIMIGDHKQLSTITLQDENKSKVTESELNEIELNDCRESLFERLFRRCQKNGWTYAYDTLTYHGRMHKEIAGFANKYFYNNILQEATSRQLMPLNLKMSDTNNQWQSLIVSNRMAFIPVRETDYSNLSDKTNHSEANIAISITLALLDVYKASNKIFDPQKSLGIIAPYRNQIALIKQKLRETGIPDLDKIMIDTVERFQGSQKDVIILSFCFNRPYQLHCFSNMNREGTVDRKLNVALTRAREQLFIIGNDMILELNPIYKKLMNQFS